MRSKYILGVLLLGVLLCAAPAMATSQQVKIVQGNAIPPMFSMTIAPGDVSMPLLPGANDVTANAITAASNTGFTISIRDDMSNTKPVIEAGKMGQYKFYSGVPVWATGLYLATPMKAGVTGGSLVPLTAVDQILKTGSAESYTGNLLLEQTVLQTDPQSLSDSAYQYTLTTTITGASV